MAKPETPENDIVQAQKAALEQIRAGDDWHTDLGLEVRLYPLAEENPPLNVSLTELTVKAGIPGDATVRTTWTASAPLTDDDSLFAGKVLADMRAALIPACLMSDPREAVAEIDLRQSGSNYAVVTYSTDSTIIIEGTNDGTI